LLTKTESSEEMRVENNELVPIVSNLDILALENSPTGSEPNEEQIQTEVVNIFNQEVSQEQLIQQISQIIQVKNRRIQDLEKKMEELTQQVFILKDKIVTAYLHFSPEPKLLKELIECQLEFTRSKKWKLPMVEQRDKLNDVYTKLRGKLKDERKVMEKVETVLNDCEELVNVEWLLEQSQAEVRTNKSFVKQLEQQTQAIHLSVQQGGIVIIDSRFGNINQTFSPQIINQKLTAYQTKEAELTERISQLESLVNNNKGKIAESQLVQLEENKKNKEHLTEAIDILKTATQNNYQIPTGQKQRLQTLEHSSFFQSLLDDNLTDFNQAQIQQGTSSSSY